MKIEIVCDICSEDIYNEERIEMKLEGPLYFNPKSKSQAQEYICPVCKHRVTVIVYA